MENKQELVIENDEPIVSVLGKIFKAVFNYEIMWLIAIPNADTVSINLVSYNGKNQTLVNISLDMYSKIVDRLKVLANLKLSVKDEPQRGHFEVTQPETDKTSAANISVIPLPHGECVSIDFGFAPTDHTKDRPFIKDDLR
jgi:type II secretory ATPase GspE/PulE/Tfp pilus assembly ATPase PilB-like protein